MDKLYTKTTWVNDSRPALNADNLNNIENGIDAIDSRLVTVGNSVATLNNGLSELNSNLYDLEYLGWSVPSECPIQNSYSNGVFTQKVGRVDLGNCDYDKAEGYPYYTIKESSLNNHKKITDRNEVPKVYCEGYTPVSYNANWLGGGVVSVYVTNENQPYVFSNTTVSDVNSFKASMKDKYLYYELATPITIKDGQEKTEKINESLDNLAYGEYCGGKNICGCDGEKYYYPLKVGDYITISKKNPSDSVLAYLYQLNADGTPADYWTANDSNLPRTVQIEKDSVYLQFSSNVSSTPLMINIGSSALTYEPYIPSIAQIKNDLANLPSGGSTVYSTTEKVVGKWIDGRNIYRCVFTVQQASSVDMQITLATGIDAVINKGGYIIGSQGTAFTKNRYTFPFNMQGIYASGYQFGDIAVLNNGDLQMRVKWGGSDPDFIAYVMCEYVKK